MDLSTYRVTVVGAGTGGAAVALLLARAGARVTLLERVAQPRAVGAGIAIAENGLAVLESLRLGAVADLGRPVTDPRITDASGRTLVAPPSPPRAVMVRRSTLQGILLDALASKPGVERRFGADVVRASGDGMVIVREGSTES